MAELIPDIQVSDFRKLNVEQIRRLKSCEVIAEGQYLFTFVNGNLEASGYLRKSSENNAQAANAIGGLSLEEVQAMEPLVKNRKVKTRKKRSRKPALAVA